MYIERTALMETLAGHRDTPEIKVLTGVRRCGKSTLLTKFAEMLLEDGVPETNVFVRRLDDFGLPLDYSAESLYAELQEAAAQADESFPLYVFLDEVQALAGWEQVVRRLHTRDNTDVFITGSNASLLSGELATLLTGRYVEIPVFPLSFAEVAAFMARLESPLAANRDRLFREYLRIGGMPALYETLTDAEPPTTLLGTAGETVAVAGGARRVEETLTAIFDSAVMRDVASRCQLRDVATLRKMCRYLFSTSGNLVSVSGLVKSLKGLGVRTSFETLDGWLDALRNAFIMYDAEQERLRGKAMLNPLRKWYPVDNGFRNLASAQPDSDLGAQLEGVVYMELRRRGYDVTIGSLGGDGGSAGGRNGGSAGGGREIDFVARRNMLLSEEREYIQVTLDMGSATTRERELAPLRELTDAFPRTVVTDSWKDVGQTPEGVRIVHVTDWLLE
ncbi:ATP-binding protein [Bifidobacterium choloepi]|uniref:ATP-binding protein n=1 Tax=Bifidobacterium choloepi TaxID=2614131 RepID=A0A6I5MZ21_9BIFI|nr:ATP-binding protein [Bifidobacterium choloepi]NEG69888.1 ATP-binding protein [Bifidobacterium choloepi]